jgi:hypothetical protein
MRIAIRNRVLPVFEVKHQSFEAFDNKSDLDRCAHLLCTAPKGSDTSASASGDELPATALCRAGMTILSTARRCDRLTGGDSLLPNMVPGLASERYSEVLSRLCFIMHAVINHSTQL